MKNDKEEFNNKIINIFDLLIHGVKLVAALVIVVTLFWIFNKAADVTTRIILTPFVVCALAALLQIVFMILKKPKYVKLMSKVYLISFLSYWFGFLCFFDYLAIKQKEYFLLVISLLFWIVGLRLTYRFFIKKDK